MKPLLLITLAVLAGCATNSNNPADQAIVETLAQQYQQSGSTESILFWNKEQRRVGFREIDQINPTREIQKGDNVYPLQIQLTDFSALTYKADNGLKTLQQFVDADENIGLIIVHKDNILYENYAEGNTKESRWISFSVTKSVTSMLIGAAIHDGYIESVDEPVANYLPRLRGTPYEAATIKDVLQMSSGVAWNEDYADPNSDVANAGALNGLKLIQYLADLPAEHAPGDVWNYNTGETNLVGQILRAAIGNNATSYLTRKIWQPFGMEFNASWTLDAEHGDELGGCCINATLRDYARLGIFAMNGGELPDGSRVLPNNWMVDSTTPSKGFAGYGYLWWLDEGGPYGARGIFGQNIYIDPSNELVVAIHSSAPAAVGTEYHRELRSLLTSVVEFVEAL